VDPVDFLRQVFYKRVPRKKMLQLLSGIVLMIMNGRVNDVKQWGKHGDAASLEAMKAMKAEPLQLCMSGRLIRIRWEKKTVGACSSTFVWQSRQVPTFLRSTGMTFRSRSQSLPGSPALQKSCWGAPSDGINTAGNHKFYANSNLDNPKVAALNVFRGEYTTLDDSDIKEVDGSNYTSLGEADLGRLVRFNKIKIRYAGVKNQDGVTPPNLKNGGNANPYPSWIVTDWGTPIFGAWYRWAYNNSEQNIRLYGSVLMSYNDAAEYTSDPGVYGIRTSGYSQFAMKPIPKDGTEGTVLGIYGIYAKKSDFTGGSEDWAQYQISVSRIEDLGFPPESLLSEEWIRANTPASSLTPPVKNGGDDYEGD
jgi:hypothetical protein